MVVGALSLQLVSVTNEDLGEGASVQNDLLGILLPCWRGDLKERGGNGSDGVVVRTTLASREDGIVDSLLEVLGVLDILAEEDEASSRATESFVTDKERSGEVERPASKALT